MKLKLTGVLIVVAAVFGWMVYASSPKIEEWEHGYKTELVIATRYANPTMGYNLGFKFPHHGADSDSTELFDFIENNGCRIYSGGGEYGAEIFAICKGVTDKESANKFLTGGFLARLHGFMAKRRRTN